MTSQTTVVSDVHRNEWSGGSGNDTSFPIRPEGWIALYKETFNEFPNLLVEYWEYFCSGHGLQFLLEQGYQPEAERMRGVAWSVRDCWSTVIDPIGTLLLFKGYDAGAYSEADKAIFAQFQSLWPPGLESALRARRALDLSIPADLEAQVKSVVETYRWLNVRLWMQE